MNPPSSPSSASSADIPLIELDFSNGCFVSSSVHPTIKRVFKKVGIAKKDLKNKTMVPIIFDCLMTVFSEIHSSEVEELKCYVEKKRTQSENIFSSQSPRLSNPSPPPPSSIPFPPSTLPPPSLLLPHHPSPSILPPQHEKEFIGNEKKEEKGIKVERIDEGNQRKEEGREVVMGEGKEEDREKEREDRREEEREGKIEESHDNCEKEDQQKGNCDEGKEKEIGEEHKSEDAGYLYGIKSKLNNVMEKFE